KRMGYVGVKPQPDPLDKRRRLLTRTDVQRLAAASRRGAAPTKPELGTRSLPALPGRVKELPSRVRLPEHAVDNVWAASDTLNGLPEEVKLLRQRLETLTSDVDALFQLFNSRAHKAEVESMAAELQGLKAYVGRLQTKIQEVQASVAVGAAE